MHKGVENYFEHNLLAIIHQFYVWQHIFNTNFDYISASDLVYFLLSSKLIPDVFVVIPLAKAEGEKTFC